MAHSRSPDRLGDKTRFFATSSLIDDLQNGADKQQLPSQIFDHCTLLGLRVHPC